LCCLLPQLTFMLYREDCISLHQLECRLRVWWPSEDGSCHPTEAVLAAVRLTGKRKFLLSFVDGDLRWSSMDRKRLRFEVLAASRERSGQQQEDAEASPSVAASFSRDARPYYIGSTDPAYRRAWFDRQLGQALPIRNWDTYYMCVGGLSGFDGLVSLCKAGASVSRVILFDRDEHALAYGHLMLTLIQNCPTRDHLLRAVFGRSPQTCMAGQQLTAASMMDFLRLDVDAEFIRRMKRTLPAKLRPIFDAVVQAAAYGADPDPDCSAIPRRRLWPCWSQGRRLPPMKEQLHGGSAETFHYGSVGWLATDGAYALLRDHLCRAEVTCRMLDLNEAGLDEVRPCSHGHVLYISNADENDKFLRSRRTLERRLSKQCKAVLVVSCAQVTLVTQGTRRAELVASCREEEPLCNDEEAGDGAILTESAMQSLRRYELLRHLKLMAQKNQLGCHKWKCSSAEDKLWGLLRILSVFKHERKGDG